MAKYAGFRLSNFRGAKSLLIKMPLSAHGAVVSLIGLNESGKTTILEGISRFGIENKVISSVFDRVYSKDSAASFIPIDFKAAFDGVIEIIADVVIDDFDLKTVPAIAETYGLEIDLDKISKSFTIRRELRFENSVLKSTTNFWDISFFVRRNLEDDFIIYERPEPRGKDLWLDISNEIEMKLPTISYFPTFLVDVPDKIYLVEIDDETPLNRYYREVIQDVLQCLSPKMSLDVNVIQRISEYKIKENSPFWVSMFFGTVSKGNIDAVFQKLANAVTREVLGSWSKVFNRPSGAKAVIIDWNIDSQRNNAPFISFSVSDGESRYKISERSLGFRWFFSFLLFTAFKQGSMRKTVFLFDEPAANLHAKAQAELLENFDRIASGGNQIVYSTHSHHMINPKWLSNAYIVDNTAIDYDTQNAFDLDARPTNVVATSYRSFVAQYPNRSTYFQPVIEKLDYVTPEVIGSGPYLIVEGITDYYALRYAKKRSGKRHGTISLMPGTGAGACGPLLSYLMGKGDRFVVLLDDDRAGKTSAAKYRDNWLLDNKQVLTIGELKPELQGKRLEGILSPKTKSKIGARMGLDTNPNKKQIGLFLAELCAGDDELELGISDETLEELTSILDVVEKMLFDQANVG